MDSRIDTKDMSDGEIYEAVSRRASPEAHALIDWLIASLPQERECCGTFPRTPHRATCEKYRGKFKPSNVEVQRDSGGIIAGGSAGTTGYASAVKTEEDK